MRKFSMFNDQSEYDGGENGSSQQCDDQVAQKGGFEVYGLVILNSFNVSTRLVKGARHAFQLAWHSSCFRSPQTPKATRQTTPRNQDPKSHKSRFFVGSAKGMLALAATTAKLNGSQMNLGSRVQIFFSENSVLLRKKI
jgi:hypothetical protein